MKNKYSVIIMTGELSKIEGKPSKMMVGIDLTDEQSAIIDDVRKKSKENMGDSFVLSAYLRVVNFGGES